MTSERIKEIHLGTAYPESRSVYQSLLQVWNECEQECNAKKNLPTAQEIKTALYKCAKVSIEADGVKMERLFDREAKAILALFGVND